MPSRLKRYQTQGDYHAINFSCRHRLHYLNDDHARIVFEETLERVRQRHQFFLFGYVLMPEHVHLLLTEPKLHSLALIPVHNSRHPKSPAPLQHVRHAP